MTQRVQLSLHESRVLLHWFRIFFFVYLAVRARQFQDLARGPGVAHELVSGKGLPALF